MFHAVIFHHFSFRGLMEFEPLFFTHYHKIPLKRKSDEVDDNNKNGRGFLGLAPNPGDI